ncbi:hypothetical protein DUNSADRAFT_1781 [Dunaliella salina]|uniref:DUF8204 domain-containing protein n=1 Tax=Dunaliella salina TaxID=3046 RepID=A0ABQ7GWL2_DUNSA|nr:hypothetical protein DUNSADRAFT_1781 [Dunaliella salina]|eukprot:KAF5839004.1 hypothetical protein DUNSADRAFT_1781 [Dunaliella salina]
MAQDHKKHSCCFGISLFTHEMKLQGRDPICFGLQTAPSSVSDSPVQSPQDPPTSAEGPWAKHICVGCSMWQSALQQQAASSAKHAQLPHCEGVEVLLVREPADSPEEASISESSQQQGGPQNGHQANLHQQQKQADDAEDKEPFWARMWARAEKNLEHMQAQLNNQGLVKFKEAPDSVEQLQERLASAASQNAERVLNGVELVASNAYSMLLKPWMDRWAERWNSDSRDSRK